MTQQNLRARQRELANEFVDKILNDPDFREQVRNDPEAAIRASDKGQEIQELNKSVKTATLHSITYM